MSLNRSLWRGGVICDDAATGAVREGPPPRSVYVPADAMEMLDLAC
ncbi:MULTISPECIES: hypothetical protein [Streptomyces]|nr:MULTISPECIES: hypothetical protein [Streptomyces]